MPDAASVLLQRLQAAFDTVEPGADPVLAALRPRRLPGQRRPGPGQAGRPAAPRGRRGGRGGGLPRRRLRRGRGQRARLHQPHPVRRLRGRPGGGACRPTRGWASSRRPTPRRSSSTTRRPTWPRRCTSATCAARSSATRSPACSASSGTRVLRENHVGDWGTPFGMLIEHLLDVDGADDAESLQRAATSTSSTPRRAAQFDSDPGFAERSRRPRRAAPGRRRRDAARSGASSSPSRMRHAGEVYDLLGVLLTPEDIVGESFYNPLLPVVVAELDEKGLLVESDGALCVFPPGFENRDGEPLPLIVRKSDGGYGYAATDLAAVRDRTGRLGATRLRLRRRGRAVPAPAPGLRRRRAWPAACPTATRPSTSPSASCSGPTARSWPAAAGGSERLIDLLTRRSSGPRAAMKERASDLVARAAGRGGRTRSASARSSTPTCPPSACATTSSTGTACSPSRATPRPTCSTRTRASAPSSGGPAWRRRRRARGAAARRAPGARAGPPAPAASRAAVEATADDLQPVQALHLPLRAGHLVHDLLRGLPGAGRRRGRARPRGSALCDLTARVLEHGLSLLGIEAPEQM